MIETNLNIQLKIQLHMNLFINNVYEIKDILVQLEVFLPL